MSEPIERRLIPPAVAERVAPLRRCTAELALAAAFVLGWLLITFAVARLVRRADVVWPLSLGLLLVSAGGWRMLALIAADGLYTLTKDRENTPHG